MAYIIGLPLIRGSLRVSEGGEGKVKGSGGNCCWEVTKQGLGGFEALVQAGVARFCPQAQQ